MKRLEALLPEFRFVPAKAGADYDAALVVCGCKTCCANVSDLALPAAKLFYTDSFQELLPTRDALRSLATAEGARTLDAEELLRILPHRPPILFIDRVTRLIPGEEAVAEYFADPALGVFAGHFPENPVFPGTLLVEAMAQAADVMLLPLEKYRGKTPYLFGLGRASFRKPVLPRDTLEIHASLLADRPEMGACVCKGQVFVQEILAADAEIILALR